MQIDYLNYDSSELLSPSKDQPTGSFRSIIMNKLLEERRFSAPFSPPSPVTETLSRARANIQNKLEQGKQIRSKYPQEDSVSYSYSPNTDYSQLTSGRNESSITKSKEPDFEKLSNIYESYIKSPRPCEKYDTAIKPSTVIQGTPTKKNIIPSSSKRPSSAPARRKTREQMIQEKEEQLRKECTFKPTINRLPANKSLNYHEKSDNLTLEAKIERWSKPRSEIQDQREKLKRELEEQVRVT